MWQPETSPMTKAMAMIDRPKAKAMPRLPSAAPATAALPQPKNVRVKVPSASAAYFLRELASMYILS